MKAWLKKLFVWLNDGERWHDLGHLMFAFILTTIFGLAICPIIGVLVALLYAIVKEFAVDGYKGFDTFYDLSHFIIGSGLALIVLMLWG